MMMSRSEDIFVIYFSEFPGIVIYFNAMHVIHEIRVRGGEGFERKCVLCGAGMKAGVEM